MWLGRCDIHNQVQRETSIKELRGQQEAMADDTAEKNKFDAASLPTAIRTAVGQYYWAWWSWICTSLVREEGYPFCRMQEPVCVQAGQPLWMRSSQYTYDSVAISSWVLSTWILFLIYQMSSYTGFPANAEMKGDEKSQPSNFKRNLVLQKVSSLWVPSEEGEIFGTLWHYCQLKWVSIISPKLYASMVRAPI